MLPAVSQVADIVQNTRDCAATLAKGTKPLSAILLKKHRLQSVADEPDFATPLTVNPDFSRLTENKTISIKCLGTVSFIELEYMEGCAKALLEANSFFLWLMSGLLSQLKRDGFKPSDLTLLTRLSLHSHACSRIRCRLLLLCPISLCQSVGNHISVTLPYCAEA